MTTVASPFPPVTPGALADAPALIERLLPVQKLSAETYKERMAVHGQTLTGLGSYWKGRKPLVLNRACVLASLLPATDNPTKDLEIFELLMGMDDSSLAARTKQRPKPREILSRVTISNIYDYFTVSPPVLPKTAPIDLSDPQYAIVRIAWRPDLPEADRRWLEARLLDPETRSYREVIRELRRPEEVPDLHDHIWDRVNAHLGTSAHSLQELVGQLGIMRFGHRPRVADPFSGSGQIPFEAARLGCDAYGADLNPVAAMLTWGAFHIVGGSPAERERLRAEAQQLVETVRMELDRLGVETDGRGWRGKVYLYCLETRCPQTGWMVPMLTTLVVSKGYRVIAELIPDPVNRRYDIAIRSGASDAELERADRSGTVRSAGRGQDPYLIHTVDGREYRTSIPALRGDYRLPDGTTGNRLRRWERTDIAPRPGDVFQERLYCIQWQREGGRESEFRAVTDEDLAREQLCHDYVAEHLEEWQEKGWIPDMPIESGQKTDEPIRTRGWTYWHHLFTPRQLLLNGLLNGHSPSAACSLLVAKSLDVNAKLSHWHRSVGGGGSVQKVFYNQALNTLYDWGGRGLSALAPYGLLNDLPSQPLATERVVACRPAQETAWPADLFITDPPYGDAINYDEILDFFIAWLRKKRHPEWAGWVWDARRPLAIKGEDEDFRQGMIACYRRFTELMPDNGLQVIMFTHQSAKIWADLAGIVWASGLQATAAWYIETETDSALRQGAYVKGTVLLVCRKRKGEERVSRPELELELQDEVKQQVERLLGLNRDARSLYGPDHNVFEDADLQMAGYAAALRVLTRYSRIDGRDMAQEARRPRTKGEKTFVDELIAYAVQEANRHLVPAGISDSTWRELNGAERFYLKMVELESRGQRSLDNFQNFAKAFAVRDFRALMGDQRANHARLKTAVELDRSEMHDGAEFGGTTTRSVLYALMELQKGVPAEEVLTHLEHNLPRFLADAGVRSRVVEIADYLARRVEVTRPEEARAARVLRELVRNQGFS